MIDVATEHLMTLVEASRLRPVGRNGRPAHVSTIHRWIKNGVRGVKLEAVRIGGARFTSREALQRFADRLTNPQGDTPVLTSPTTTAAQGRAAQRADRLLDGLGF